MSGAATAIRGPAPLGPSEQTATGSTATTARNPSESATPRSNPPPLPNKRSDHPAPGPESVATTIRGLGKGGSRDGGLETEIDASLDRLELDGPTGTSLPEGIAALPMEETAATRTLEEGTSTKPKRTSRRPKDLAFTATQDEVTESGQLIPHTLKEMRDANAMRPMLASDPTLMGGESESLRAAAPVTVPGGPETVDGGVVTSPGSALESGDLMMDVEDPTGADMKVDLEMTHAGAIEDEIVIADDLAEIVDDPHDPHASDAEEEHTETGGPPYRGNS